ncbi:MAG: uracil-DNA glycosylase [Calditrichales bacterium]|nr:MAG: uracil-DNA glycosylase [Calditrichales bacterium]
MKSTIEEIENFFKAQAEMYGKDILLDGRLTDPRVEIKPVSAPVSAVATAPKKTGANPLEQFYFDIKECQLCPLGKTRTNFVFGVGNPKADLMFIGEAPGRDEDLQGIPFVGRAGQLLTLMLQTIGLKREDVFIANVLKCRPPNNRDPQTEEIEKCEPYLLKQIEMISPRLIVTLGRFASASLLRTKAALGALREEVHSYNQVPLVVTYHPAALLRNPQLKRQAWIDLKRINHLLQREEK